MKHIHHNEKSEISVNASNATALELADEKLLFSAINQNNLDLANQLITKGAKLNEADAKLASPILWKSMHDRQVHTALVLIKAGANIQSLPFLHLAIKMNSLEIVQALIAAGINKESLLNGGTPFHYAVQYGTNEIVLALLEAGVNKEFIWHDLTPLCHGIKLGRNEIVKTLIEGGADKEASCSGMTPLHFAISHGQAQIVKTLLDAGANKEDGNPAIHFAIYNNNPEMVKLLITEGINIESLYNHVTPLHLAIQNKNNDMVKMLIGLGADIEALSGNMPPLYLAIQSNIPEIVKTLLKKGANVKTLFVNQTALRYSIFLGNAEIIQALIDAGAEDPNITPLHIAIELDNEEKLLNLIEEGVNLEARHEDLTPLHIAICRKKYVLIQTLINAGADIEALSQRITPLYRAIKCRDLQIVQMLIKAKANIETKVFDETPLHYAVQQANSDITQALIDAGAQYHDVSSLHCAIFLENMDAISTLIETGTNLEVLFIDMTPLAYAIRLEKNAIAHLLLKGGANKNISFSVFKKITDPTLAEVLLPHCLIEGVPLEKLLLNSNSFNSSESRKEFATCKNPPEFLHAKELIAPVTFAALQLLNKERAAKKYEEELISEERNEHESAMADSFITHANWHFKNKVEPHFRGQFTAETIEPLIAIENCIRTLLLKHILEQAETANEQSTIAFIQENKDKLIQADPAIMQASCAIFTQTSAAQAAWRGYNPFAPVASGEWLNLLTTPTDNSVIYSTDAAHEGELQAQTASELLRTRVAYYYLAVIDANDGDDATRAIRIENFISQLADIRNAHGTDDPSCYPGSITRCANMGAFHSIAQLPPTTKKLLTDFIKIKVLEAFKMELEKLTTFAEKEMLYQALVELTTLQAKEIILYPERYLETWLPIRQRFIDKIGTAEEIFEQIVEKSLIPVIEEDIVFIEQALLDITGGTINAALADYFNRHTDSVPTETELQHANPFMHNDTTNYHLADILLKSIFQSIPVYAASTRKLKNLSEYLAHKIPALSKGAPLRDLLTGLEIAEQDFNKVLQAITSALEHSGWQAPILIVNPFDAQAQQIERLIKMLPPQKAEPHRKQLKSLQTKQQYFNDYLPSVQQAFQDCSLNNDNLASITEALAMQLAIADGRFDPTEFCNFLNETDKLFVQQHPKLLENLPTCIQEKSAARLTNKA